MGWFEQFQKNAAGAETVLANVRNAYEQLDEDFRKTLDTALDELLSRPGIVITGVNLYTNGPLNNQSQLVIAEGLNPPDRSIKDGTRIAVISNDLTKFCRIQTNPTLDLIGEPFSRDTFLAFVNLVEATRARRYQHGQ